MTTTPDAPTPDLRAQVLGPIRLEVDGVGLSLGGPTPRAILAMLLLNAGGVVSRPRLVDGLWGSDPPATADATVQSHVSRLRSTLREHDVEHLLATQAPGYRVDLDDFQLDVLDFERRVRRGRAHMADDQPRRAVHALEDALATWTGDPVADLQDFPFALGATARLAEARLSAVEARNDCLLALGDVDALLPTLREMVDQHPLRERLRQQTMLALYHGGRHTEALDELRSFRDLLGEELGLEPGPGLEELQQRILAHDVPPPRHAVDRPAAARPDVDRHGGAEVDESGEPTVHEQLGPSVASLDEFVGRRDELRAIEARMAQGVRLVTVTGAGGAGKTRLALEVARRWERDTGVAATTVALDSLAGSGLVVTRVARALGLQGSASAAAIGELLAEEDRLLVLDNMEHLLEAGTALADLLRRAPGLRIVVTSQVPLRINGEHEVAVPPLPLPVGDDPDDLRHNDAVRLFLIRAQARVAAFDDDDATVRDVAAIVRLLDGMPLAIELAAARVKVLTPRAMLAPLRQGLDVLSDPGRRGADRRRTLAATIAWSIDLLSDELQEILAALSVLVGRFDLDDAVAIAGTGSQMQVVDALGQLADHSLVQRIEVDGRVRFGMLRTIRVFARSRLALDPEREEAARRRRDHHFIGEASRRSARMVDEVGSASTGWVRDHVDDLRTVLEQAWDREDVERCTELSASLAIFWGFVQSPEGRRWMERGLSATPPPSAEQRARLHTGLARMCMFGGPLEVARRHAEAALASVEAGAQPHNAVFALNVLGQVAAHDGRRADAERHALAAMEIAEGPDGTDMLAIIARNYRADMLLSFERWHEAVDVSREVLDLLARDDRAPTTEHEVFALSNLALAHIHDGRLAEALAALDGLAEATHRVRTPVGEAMVLLGHAAVATHTDLPPVVAGSLVDAAVVQLDRHGAGLGVPEQRLLDETRTRLKDVEDPRPDDSGPAHGRRPGTGGSDGAGRDGDDLEDLVRSVRAAVDPGAT